MIAAHSPAPTDLDELLSPAWLTSALGKRFPGLVVGEATVVERLETLATKVRFTVTYAETAGHDVTHALCVKGYFSEAGAAWASLGSREARFYADLAPELPIQVPTALHTGIDPSNHHGVVIMEDLVAKGATFLTALSPYGPAQVAATLELLASLHASHWNDADLQSAAWLAPTFAGYANVMPDEDLDVLLDGPRGAGIPTEVRQARRLKSGLAALARRQARGPSCLVHADAHAGNLYESADGRPGLIDWQIYQFAQWSIDVAYHVAAVLDPSDRERTERDLLCHYLERLVAAGVEAPRVDDAWDDYRASLVYGYYLWAITRKVDEAITLEFNRRLGTAVTAHESLDLCQQA